jgi:glycosyltransferase involved in cell wall biosynthesis
MLPTKPKVKRTKTAEQALASLMRLCARLKEYKPDLKVAIVGTGELEEEVKNLCQELQIQDNVQFLGFQTNPIKMVHDSKVMILTSRWEGTPMCALEAMALGVPVVSTPTDGLVDLLDEGETGFLSDEDAVLAEKAVALATDPELRNRMSCIASRKAVEINDVKTYKEAIAKWY